MEYYVHHVPGRLRVRIPAIRKNPRHAAEIQSLLNIYGVDNIAVNHLTGSVVVTFDTDLLSPEQLLNLLKEKGYYDHNRTVTCDETLQRASNIAATKVGRAMFGYAVGKALEASGLSLLAALI
jgi:Heavy metal associated domain 2